MELYRNQTVVNALKNHTYIHKYIHTYVYKHMSYIHTCTYIHTYMHTYIHTQKDDMLYIQMELCQNGTSADALNYIHTYIHTYTPGTLCSTYRWNCARTALWPMLSKKSHELWIRAKIWSTQSESCEACSIYMVASCVVCVCVCVCILFVSYVCTLEIGMYVCALPW